MLALVLALAAAPSPAVGSPADAGEAGSAADAGSSVTAPALARAAPGLRWVAPPQCATQAEVRADVDALADQPREHADGTESVDAAVVRTGEGYRLRLERRRGDGTLVEARTLKAADCKVLSRATALIVAVSGAPLAVSARVTALEAEAAAAAVVPAAGETSAAVAGDSSAPAAANGELDPVAPPRERERDRDERRRISPPGKGREAGGTRRSLPKGWRHRFVGGGLFGLSVGEVPGATPSIAGFGGYALGPLRLELSGAHAFARTREVEVDASVEVRSSGGGATFVVAPHLGPLVVLAGVGLRAGTIRGAGQGPRVRGVSASDWWATVPILGGVVWPRETTIALRAQLEIAIAARRPGIVIERPSGGNIGGFRRPATTFAALVGPEIRLP